MNVEKGNAKKCQSALLDTVAFTTLYSLLVLAIWTGILIFMFGIEFGLAHAVTFSFFVAAVFGPMFGYNIKVSAVQLDEADD